MKRHESSHEHESCYPFDWYIFDFANWLQSFHFIFLRALYDCYFTLFSIKYKVFHEVSNSSKFQHLKIHRRCTIETKSSQHLKLHLCWLNWYNVCVIVSLIYYHIRICRETRLFILLLFMEMLMLSKYFCRIKKNVLMK